jgi:tetratricopeptide (TPR) repeat protein/class 3 adenylate cyclase
VVSATTAAFLPAGLLSEPRGDGFLLRAGASLPDSGGLRLPDRELHEGQLLAGIPVALREHVLSSDADSEHRRATVAFVGYHGVDNLLAREGAEVVGEHLNALVNSVQAACDAHGVTFLGTDVARDGGKILLVAGAPTAAGEDEQRLLLAACEVRDAAGILPVQIGVSSGPLFAGGVGPPYRRTYTVMGDTVNLAARVMARAEPGQVLAANEVLDAADIEFASSPVEPFMAKGKRAAVGAAVVRAPLGSKRTTSPDLPLVGRELEQDTLRDALAMMRKRHGGMIEVIGPAGIGKTRLLDELRVGAAGMPQLLARCELYESSSPYLPFRRILRTLLGCAQSLPPDQTAIRLRERVMDAAPELAPWLPLLAVVVDADVEPTPEVTELGEEFRAPKLIEATTQLFERLITEPTLIAVEDVHWMDAASVDLAHGLLARVDELPWLVCFTRRDDPTGFQPTEPRVGTELRPRPLTVADSERLITAATEHAPLRPHDAQTLARRSGGNPLFLHGLLGAVGDSGSVDGLPHTIEAMVVAQVDRLGTTQRRLVRHASVLGLAFSTDLVAMLLDPDDDPPERGAWSGLDELLAQDGPGRFRFRHALTRDAAYEGLSYRRRRELHARAAAAIVTRRAGPDDDLDLLALHYLQAGDNEQAWLNARAAARLAEADFAIGDAVVNYHRALEAARHLHGLSAADRVETLEAVGDLHERMGRYDHAAARFTEARRLVPDDPVVQGRLCFKHSMLAERSGSYPQAVRWLRRGLRGLEGDLEPSAVQQRARLAASYGMVRLAQGRRLEAVDLLEHAIEESKASGEKSALAHAYFCLDWALSELGRGREAVYSPLALDIYQELGELGPQAVIYNNLGTFCHHEGRWDEAVDLYQKGYDLRMRLGDTVDAATGTNNIAEVLSNQGHLEEAQRRFEEALRVWRAADFRIGVAYALSNLGRVAYRDERHPEALALLERAREMFQAMHADAELVETDARRAECLVLHGASAEALRLADDALGRAQALGSAVEVSMLERIRGFALLQLGDIRAARRALELSLAGARELGASYEVALTLDALVRLAMLETGIVDVAARNEADALFTTLGLVRAPEVPLNAPAGRDQASTRA